MCSWRDGTEEIGKATEPKVNGSKKYAIEKPEESPNSRILILVSRMEDPDSFGAGKEEG